MGSFVRILGGFERACEASQGFDRLLKGLFKGPCCQVHGADCEERQCVNSDHDNNEKAIQDHFDESDDKLCVQHKYSLVLPGILAKKTWKLINY